MTCDEFANKAMKEFSGVTDPTDRQLLHYYAVDFYILGWKLEDAIAYMRLTEEADPTIPEDFALRRMNIIRKKYIKDTYSQKN